MEKTIRSFLLLMIITGTIFTACGPETVPPVQVESDADPSTESELVKEEMGADSEGGGNGDGKVEDDSVPVTLEKTGESISNENANVETKTTTPVIKTQPKIKKQPVNKTETPPQGEPASEPVVPVEETAPVQSEPVSNEPVVVEVATKYIDGSYTRSGGYQSPAGAEAVSVTVTVKDDKVQSMTVFSSAVNDTSEGYQGLFIAGINQLVVGKKLSDVGGVGQVNGSSLTGGGFNSAIASIKAAALR